VGAYSIPPGRNCCFRKNDPDRTSPNARFGLEWKGSTWPYKKAFSRRRKRNGENQSAKKNKKPAEGVASKVTARRPGEKRALSKENVHGGCGRGWGVGWCGEAKNPQPRFLAKTARAIFPCLNIESKKRNNSGLLGLLAPIIADCWGKQPYTPSLREISNLTGALPFVEEGNPRDTGRAKREAGGLN